MSHPNPLGSNPPDAGNRCKRRHGGCGCNGDLVLRQKIAFETAIRGDDWRPDEQWYADHPISPDERRTILDLYAIQCRQKSPEEVAAIFKALKTQGEQMYQLPSADNFSAYKEAAATVSVLQG